MDLAQLLASTAFSAIVAGLFGYWIKKTEAKASKDITRSTVEAEAYTRAEAILSRIISAQEREMSDMAAEIESLKLQLREKR